MKNAYPIIMTPDEEGFIVYVPDFNINTEGKSLADAIEMARDAIGIVGIDMEDENEKLPTPTPIAKVKTSSPADTVTLVDIDFTEYRRKHDVHSVKKNCTIPSWLSFEAEKAGVNFSSVLTTALKKELNLPDPPQKPSMAKAKVMQRPSWLG